MRAKTILLSSLLLLTVFTGCKKELAATEPSEVQVDNLSIPDNFFE